MPRFQTHIPPELQHMLFGDIRIEEWLALLAEKAGFTDDGEHTVVMDGRYLLLRPNTLASLAQARPGTTLLDPQGGTIACVSKDATLTAGSPTRCLHGDEARCANSAWDAAQMARLAMQQRHKALCDQGVRFVDPSRVWIGARAVVHPGATIFPNVALMGMCVVHNGVTIRERVSLTDTVVEQGTTVLPGTVVTGAHIGPGCSVGPMAHLRPGTVLTQDNKVGNFVETKHATLDTGAKASHLSYLGDTRIGARANIGAGTITCNYDGWSKHQTTIGDDAFIGSNTCLVAPVQIGDGSIVGAGSVITETVEGGALALTRSPQQALKGAASRIHERNRKRSKETKGSVDE